MKPVAFEYRRPDTVDEAVGLLANHGAEAKVLAGGQSLVPLMNFRLARPAYLVDINGLGDLSYIHEDDGHVAIGALTRQSMVEDAALVANNCPLLAEATTLIGHRTIRNRGTVGGTIAHADPSAEYPAVLLALDGDVEVRGSAGTRRIPARDFFVSVLMTAVEPDELVTEVRMPRLPATTGFAFEELVRRHGDYAIVGVAAALTLDGQGDCADARIALAGVHPTPLRCPEAEAMLKGQKPRDETFREAAASCAAAVSPTSDIHASSAYRKAMVAVFVRRALEKALSRIGSP